MLIAYVVRVIRKHPLRLSVGGDALIAPPRPQARNLPASLCEGGVTAKP